MNVRRLPYKSVDKLYSKYSPWLEYLPELTVDSVQHFQELIGQFFWAVNIGRIDIILKISLMSSYLDMPRIGNLD